MSRILFIILFSFSIVLPVFNQTDMYPFVGEGNTNEVRLMWLPSSWPENLNGFIVKRRKIKRNKTGNWELVSKDVILPGCSIHKNLSNVEPDLEHQKLLKQKLEKYLSGNQEINLKQRTKDDFISSIRSNSKYMSFYSMIYYRDFDIAIMHGFALIDRNIPKAKTWEYGLFLSNIDGSEELVNTFSWDYGSKPNIDIPMEMKYKAKRKNKAVHIEWSFKSSDYFDNNKIAGFNMYRKVNDNNYIRLNDKIITVIQGGTKEVSVKYYDKDIDTGNVYLYGLAPVSLFRNEGNMQTVKYDDAEVPNEFPDIILKIDKKDSLNVRNNGVLLSWDLSPNYNKYIDGFSIVRKVEEKIDTITTLNSTLRRYVDTELPLECRISYRLVIDVKGGYKNEQSDWEKVSLPYTPPVPTGIKTEIVQKQDGDYIMVTWDEKTKEDTITWGYKVYETDNNETASNAVLFGSVDCKVKVNKYITKIGNAMYSGKYGFAVSALPYIDECRENKWCYNESAISNIVYVSIPSKEISNFIIDWDKINDKQVKITWEYPVSYWDLIGFKVFMNGEMVADHNTLGAKDRSYTSPELPKGVYIFTVQAYTKSGVESKVFNKCRFTVK
jgi:hypothetical protein